MGEALRVFPVLMSWDPDREKWKKKPATRGQDWKTYQATPAELKKAKNFGIVIPAGLIVLDLDEHKGVTTEDVDRALGVTLEWEGALVQHTVSGGAHYAFRVPEGVHLQQGSNLLGVDGFDTRAAGRGYICAGERYQDETMIGLPEALRDEPWPALPPEAVQVLSDGSQTVVDGDADPFAGLEAAIAQNNTVEGLTDADVRVYLETLPAGDVDRYDEWLRVGMALSHQYAGSNIGLELWREWSEQSKSYDLDELNSKWGSFKGGRGNPTTFAYVIQRAGGKGALGRGQFIALCRKACQVEDFRTYEELKKEVQALDVVNLPDDLRGMVASEVAKGYGKTTGLTKAEIKKSMQPPKEKKRVTGEGGQPLPEWLNPWVYVEKLCEFADTVNNYGIRRDAFAAKYDRMVDCLAAGKTAPQFALVDMGIPTVVDRIFYPGKDRIFEDEKGLPMLNGYHESGVNPCMVIDEDGQNVIQRFLDHVRFTLADPREQMILIDWLTFVIQNPGKRVNWALLIQGCQGSGKSYFVYLLQQIMGVHVKNLDPSAITRQFTGWAYGALVIAVEEIRISGANRYEVLDRLKFFISNDKIPIEEKGRDHRTVPNFASYIMLTNHKDAIPLSDGDRRYCIFFSRAQSEAQLFEELGGKDGVALYFEMLFSETRRRADALARWFLDRDVSLEFDPAGRAPETVARLKMTNSAVSPERTMIEDAIAEYECKVIGRDLVDVTYLNDLCRMGGEPLPKTRAVSAILLELGYEQIDKRSIKVGADRKNHYIWRTDKVEDEEARDLVRDFFKPAEFTPD